MTLVLASSLLTRLQLIQIPSTDGQIALVLVHALAEVGHFTGAHGGCLVIAGLDLLGCLLLLDGCRGATAEPAADGLANGGADCDATAKLLLAFAMSEERKIRKRLKNGSGHTLRSKPSGQQHLGLGLPGEEPAGRSEQVDGLHRWPDGFEVLE